MGLWKIILLFFLVIVFKCIFFKLILRMVIFLFKGYDCNWEEESIFSYKCSGLKYY